MKNIDFIEIKLFYKKHKMENFEKKIILILCPLYILITNKFHILI